MEKSRIIGRIPEKKIIESCINSNNPELLAVYGRRRVGKTYLIKCYFNETFNFSFTGMYDTSRVVMLSQFQKTLENYAGKKYPKFKDWFEAFDTLSEYLSQIQKDKIVVFIDELPWLDTPKSNFIQAFSSFWNNYHSSNNILKLIVCGSATTWMISKLIGDKGGLYGRVTRQIYLAPFNLSETEQFITSIKRIEYNRNQILQLYMTMGGIPYYLNMIEKELPLSKNIDNLYFKTNAPLRTEFSFLFRSLFKNSKIYYQLVKLLSTKSKGLTRAELIDNLNIKEGGVLSEALDNLISCDFIRKYSAIGKTERDAQYQLCDPYSLFYLKFVADNNGQDEDYWTNLQSSSTKTTWSGYAFEQICFLHIRQIKKAIGISGISSNVYSWQSKPFTDKDGIEWKGGQIDMLIDRADNVINICEIKYHSDKFVITSDYEERLRERASLFQKVTKTNKTLQHIFITSYGVKQNMHSGIVQNEAVLDDLFSN